MALNGTMVAIQTVTVGSGGAANIEFTNIPQTYTDLKIVLSMRTNGAGASGNAWTPCIVTFNTTTTTSSRQLFGTGSGTGSDTGVNNVYTADTDNTASTFSNSEIYIPNYTGTTQKSYSADSVTENNATGSLALMAAGLTNLTSAITSVKVAPDTNSFAQYTTATLYGISRTTAQIKATGGMVYEDDTYVYHAFRATDSFVPTQVLTADVLIVAGGGGGGISNGGGGGAGGVRTSTGLSFSATSHTITVGAGGAGGDNPTSGSNSSAGSVIASTGGGRGKGDNSTTGNNGGSGGGGYPSSTAPGTGNAGNYSPVEGYAGGTGRSSSNPGGAGGGGAGAVGQDGQSGYGGNGGIGTTSSIINAFGSITGTGQLSSSNYYFGGGGGGGYYFIAPYGGTGGLGGGASATTNASPAASGTANMGGGGAGGASSGGRGGAGGSGIVIIRYAK
jgi:hypothetical protein